MIRRISVFLAVPLLCAAGALAQVATQTSLTISPDSVEDGYNTTVSVTVSATSGTPTGSVGIYVGSTDLFNINLTNGSGSATVHANGLAAGKYTVVAKYPGNASFGSSQTSAAATVLSPVQVSLEGVPNPVVSGQTAKLVADLTSTDGGGMPTGQVRFAVGNYVVGTATIASGQAVLSAPTTGIPTGTYPVVAEYLGDSLHAAMNSAAVNVVLEAAGGTACGTGNENELNGNYTFSLNGFSTGSETPYFTVGAFVADGTGSITGGEEDFNNMTSASSTTISNVSSYSVGSDGRGCMTLVTSDQVTRVYRFSLGKVTDGTVSTGRMIEFDDANGAGTRAAGSFLTTALSQVGLADLQPQYAFALSGFSQSNEVARSALYGSIAISTSGVISSGVTDSNFAGAEQLNQPVNTGSLSAPDSFGRAILTFTAQGQEYSFVAYETSENHFAVLSNIDSSTVPVLAGNMHSVKTGFTASTIYPTWVDHLTGTSASGNTYDEVLALTTFNADGQYSSTRYVYSNGKASTVLDSGTFTVSGNGRMVLVSSSGNTPQIYYLYNQGTTYIAGSGAYELGLQSPVPTSGASDEQDAATYSDSLVAGLYNFGNGGMLNGAITNEIGQATVSSAGAVTGAVDESGPTGLIPDATLSLNAGTLNFTASGVSETTGYVAMATGNAIYEIKENGSLNPLYAYSIIISDDTE